MEGGHGELYRCPSMWQPCRAFGTLQSTAFRHLLPNLMKTDLNTSKSVCIGMYELTDSDLRVMKKPDGKRLSYSL